MSYKNVNVLRKVKGIRLNICIFTLITRSRLQPSLSMTEINTHGMILTQKDSAKKGFESVVVFLGGDENEESRGKGILRRILSMEEGGLF